MRWDRKRSEQDLNQEGPGWYFTSDLDDALRYGPIIYRAKMKPKAKIIQATLKSSLPALLAFVATASDGDLQDWGADFGIDRKVTSLDVRKILANYSAPTLLESMLALYHDLFRYQTTDYLRAAQFVADGVRIKKKNGVFHLVVWNPSIVLLESP
jgi:hypothetical protein